MANNPAIDITKGILLVFVIIGHALLGTLGENVIRAIIYSFHMPLFLFVSGYLLNIKKINDFTVLGFLKHYWGRMIKWWLIAVVLYAFITADTLPALNSIIHSLIYPYFHLWYISTLFLAITICFLARKWNVRYTVLILTLIGIIGCFLKYRFVIVDEWRIHYFIYIALGIALRNGIVPLKKTASSNKAGGLVLLLSAIALSAIIALIHKSACFTYYQIINIPFLFVMIVYGILPLWNKYDDDIRSMFKPFAFMGRDSLHIYLWHYVFIIFASQLCADSHLMYYLIASISTTIFISSLYFFKNKTNKL